MIVNKRMCKVSVNFHVFFIVERVEFGTNSTYLKYTDSL